ncbi:sigma-54-dependent Fis family transcriptional regulator [Propionispora vibrioides]|uniref:Transcriptional regulator containing PAS, AAA-type ATPase, and DNA-binding Fis domains n=1 Tax=Propionispora vibrioides TaxID=112903 RepID=A0A1H8Y0M7_9FIRM|nr:sigma 54-interacting transcriptional regulator [Propionispora vibrioides]SEP45659.1 Transcriptional regulator containing PAS, AAA-type ATPase, and DNA-binding Fis domains [Propionispora vibrioides]
MIRERRSKGKLESYYHQFVHEGKMDPNVHPWVAESWQRSAANQIAYETMPSLTRLSKAELAERQQSHQTAIEYLQGLYQDVQEHFTRYNLSLLLLDHECYVLKSYAMPFFQKTPGEVAGARLTEEDIGTSSISIAYEHQVPFLLFGPEMWIEECQTGDAFSAPIILGGQTRYLLTLISAEREALPYSSVAALMFSMKYAMEKHLDMQAKLVACQAILDAVPLAVYHIEPGGEVTYANKLGEERLEAAGAPHKRPSLNEVVLNYRHTPLYRGFLGIPSYNKEVTWITPTKTYEDITTVVPLYGLDKEVDSVLAVSLPIEDLRNMVAHAVGYTARYSLASMVGEDEAFVSLKDKAARIARSGQAVLLQGEPGSGKQRLAHGIHQASPRAGGPLITLKCGDMPPEMLEDELFGVNISAEESRTGKLELANGGTLFLDEVEKLPLHTAVRLAESLEHRRLTRIGEEVLRPIDVRIIAACDSDLKRLSEKGIFSESLYKLVSKSIIRMMPLRARKDDIPVLARHIMAEIAGQHRMTPKELAPEAAEFLMSYDWPGNVKQLQGVVEQAFFNTPGETIMPANINLPGNKSLAAATWKEDREVFIEAWKSAGGNISRLANMLNVSRVTLYRYLKKYGLEKD